MKVDPATANKALLEAVNTAAAKERDADLAPVHATSEYTAAKADLDRAATARADAKAHGTADEILATGNTDLAAAEAVNSLEFPATSADAVLASARGEAKMVQVASDAVAIDAHPTPLTDKQKAQATDCTSRFSKAGTKLAEQLSTGVVPVLNLKKLAIDDMGIVGSDAGVAVAHVESVMEPADALVSVEGIYVRLSKYPLPVAVKGKDIPLTGVFSVTGEKHLLSKFHQPTAFVLEPVDADAVTLVAESMREQSEPVLAASAIHHSWDDPHIEAFGSVEGFLASSPVQISDKSQVGTVQDQLREKWLSEHALGEIVNVNTTLTAIDLNGRFVAYAEVQDVGSVRNYRIVGNVVESSLQSLGDAKGGSKVHFRGAMLIYNARSIELKDATAETYTEAQTMTIHTPSSAGGRRPIYNGGWMRY